MGSKRNSPFCIEDSVKFAFKNIDSVSFKGNSRDSRSDAEKTNGYRSPTSNHSLSLKSYGRDIAARAAPPFCSSLRPESHSPGRATAPIPRDRHCNSHSSDVCIQCDLQSLQRGGHIDHRVQRGVLQLQVLVVRQRVRGLAVLDDLVEVGQEKHFVAQRKRHGGRLHVEERDDSFSAGEGFYFGSRLDAV